MLEVEQVETEFNVFNLIHGISLCFIQIAKYEKALQFISSILYVKNLSRKHKTSIHGIEEEFQEEIYNYLLKEE